MVPYNFEENIKQKLEERTIKPSVNAWDKLSQKIDKQNKGSKSKFIWWLGVAASIVGILFVSLFFLGKSENQSSEIEIVDTPIFIEETSTKEGSQIEVIATNETEPESESKNQNTSQENQIIKLKSTINKQEIQAKKELVASNSSTKTKDINRISLIKEELETQVVTIEHAPESNLDIDKSIDSEIDLLLKNAQQNITTKRMVETSSVVSASSLLEDVEMDLERSFRDKVFETVKSGYKTVKTAVAERNN